MSVLATSQPVSQDFPGLWQMMFVELPDGDYRVIIEGRRGVSGGVTSLAIDDITIWPCSKYCKTTFVVMVLTSIYF